MFENIFFKKLMNKKDSFGESVYSLYNE